MYKEQHYTHWFIFCLEGEGESDEDDDIVIIIVVIVIVLCVLLSVVLVGCVIYYINRRWVN